MSAPALSRLDAVGDRLYVHGRPTEGFYSVTTIINGGVPKYLGRWYAKEVAELAFSDLMARGPFGRARAAIRAWARAGRAEVALRQERGELTSITRAARMLDEEAALRWMKGQPERKRDAAGVLGIDFHDEAEREILRLANATALARVDEIPRPWPEHLAGHEATFRRFLRIARPEYVATEATIFNRTQGYAGTLDAIMVLNIGGQLLQVIVDYKSGRDVYAEVALQLAAYARGEFIGHPDGVGELPVPVVDAGAVLHITPKRFRLQLVRIDEPVYRAFLHAREVFRFRKDLAGTVFLQDSFVDDLGDVAASHRRRSLQRDDG